ncbi:predicted protein [Nematostella vectensis]|uniref:DZIP3-like HEPN domain-containing protein n=1 Tax=Nematostella vectensis TaxID=45351 RepID=A7T6T5_NEMVE|nr:predicted protein [Nematostella vectensis]|eukprot:XP_001620420.1 hypothetical protein NEMVEDRAFT_v1g248790 [Nematostella vectensis]
MLYCKYGHSEWLVMLYCKYGHGEWLAMLYCKYGHGEWLAMLYYEMASALSGSEKKDNFQKLSRLLIDGGTKSLRNYFSSFHPPTTLTASLNAHKSTLTGLKGKVLKPHQWDLLFPKSGPPSTAENYDITLLTCLLRNICGLAPPASTTSWDKLPPATDQTKVAQVVRLRHYRNDLYAHIKTTEVETADFNHYWADISAALLSLGVRHDKWCWDISKFSHGSEGAAMSINPMAEFTSLGQSRDLVDDDFDEFRQQHDKVYEDDSEHRRRKHIFRHNVMSMIYTALPTRTLISPMITTNDI